MNTIFWNVNLKKVNLNLIKLFEKHDLDILILAEYKDNDKALLREGLKSGIEIFSIPQGICNRIKIFSKYKPSNFELILETEYYVIVSFSHKTLGKILIVSVHLPSKTNANEIDMLVEGINLKKDINHAENIVGYKNTILVGDFNMNPFEKPMITAAALHALPTKNEVRDEERTIRFKNYNMFYNPMWKFIAEEENGTYYYSSPPQDGFRWNYFDQVMVRPGICENITDVKIIKEIGGKRIVTKKETPLKTYSDHLPIYFNIQ
ncbi:endonuclease/exonuclease/phosphatase family protein [Exiguobacterium acetylicum]|uniref:endonuclease/exonuclease/phosphatase family protein n=1 Tax=Exiguobacterium acetylicum TaxID=41170 RepID=UPI0034D6562E